MGSGESDRGGGPASPVAGLAVFSCVGSRPTFEMRETLFLLSILDVPKPPLFGTDKAFGDASARIINDQLSKSLSENLT